MRFERLALEFRMELAAKEVGMVWEFYDLDVSSVWCSSRDLQSRTCQQGFVFAIELIAVAMALADIYLAV